VWEEEALGERQRRSIPLIFPQKTRNVSTRFNLSVVDLDNEGKCPKLCETRCDLLLSLLSELENLQLPPPRVGMEFSWEELPKALEAFQSGKTSGKIVIKL